MITGKTTNSVGLNYKWVQLSLLLCILGACAGKVPETRYYQLAATRPVGHEPADTAAALVVESLDTDNAYDDDRIVYRLTPYRLDYYNYHRWSSPPGVLVGNYLVAAAQASGRFSAVTREANPQAAVTLGGRVVAIEEVDTSKTAWVGHVVVELRLTDTVTGDVVWTHQFDETEPVKTQTPEGLAQALSAALGRIANDAIPIVAEQATRVEAARAPARTQSGSARAQSASGRRPAASVREAAELRASRNAHR